MTTVRSDERGLFIRAGGYVARPGNVAGHSHVYRMDAANLQAGDKVKARHLAGSPILKLTLQDGTVLHWCRDADESSAYQASMIAAANRSLAASRNK